MFKNMKKRIKNEKGLTLIELLAVIVILAIIAAIAIPAIGNIIDNSRIKAVKADAANIINAANLYYTDGNTATFTQSTAGEYVGDPGSFSAYSVDNSLTMTTGTAESGGRTYTLTNATINGLEIESAEIGAEFGITRTGD
ncbi:hypothetical protein CD33_18750 [Ureibacillus sinduriensis BLB-1 = JCM 15800]|uniref:Tfp assembly type protein n=2 Tax=Ureibacillus sinduriensis TaxID=561440 RepID=A0A0A3HUP8_9BACL|nr:prepilin-type N-terminal cleavage/methylation domain-containing protein [Ureibacillus sinduriensis]KGR74038.1 hypothetical protein CD33_18750 [Ureibacillus sinduriensis BLB-1 = JCM 15800]